MLALQKIRLEALTDGEWSEYFALMVNKATRNTGEMEPVRTSKLENFMIQETIRMPITRPIPAAPMTNLHTNKHSLHNVPWRIDNLIDQYADQQKVAEVIRVHPATARLLSNLMSMWHGKWHYIFQGTILIRIITDSSIDIDSIFIDYK